MAGGKTESVIHRVAIICGVSGLVGRELAKRLINSHWKVYGVARNQEAIPIKNINYHFISCNLLNPPETHQKLSLLKDVTHLFWVTWASDYPLDIEECSEQNKTMMENALNAILPNAKELKHVSLQTGMKHYVSLQFPFIDKLQLDYYKEESPRVTAGHNFYYVLEDLLRERLAAQGNVCWSVHRPGLITGSSHRTLYNFMGSLCVYGTICKYLNLPFIFGGTRQNWEEPQIDGSDARLVAEQHIWAATNNKISSTNGQAFNALNGTSFTWKEIWPTLARKFEVKIPDEMFSEGFSYEMEMRGKEKVWQEIVVKEGLLETRMEDLANWEFLDVLFRCPMKLLGSREKADRLGFKMRYKTLDSFLYWIDHMRDEKFIPGP
ncbi:hypothetical protein ACFE04_011968 [Oxalis oulophora]